MLHDVANDWTGAEYGIRLPEFCPKIALFGAENAEELGISGGSRKVWVIFAGKGLPQPAEMKGASGFPHGHYKLEIPPSDVEHFMIGWIGPRPLFYAPLWADATRLPSLLQPIVLSATVTRLSCPFADTAHSCLGRRTAKHGCQASCHRFGEARLGGLNQLAQPSRGLRLRTSC